MHQTPAHPLHVSLAEDDVVAPQQRAELLLKRSLAVCLRPGRWIHLLPTGADSFDAEVGGFALQFTRNAAAEVTEVKASGTRVRNLRHTRVALPKNVH